MAGAVAAAHTITREIRAFCGHAFDPDEAARITIPVLVVTGSETPDVTRDDPEAVAAALPDARIAVIQGEQHLADALAPAEFADCILAFLRE